MSYSCIESDGGGGGESWILIQGITWNLGQTMPRSTCNGDFTYTLIGRWQN